MLGIISGLTCMDDKCLTFLNLSRPWNLLFFYLFIYWKGGHTWKCYVWSSKGRSLFEAGRGENVRAGENLKNVPSQLELPYIQLTLV